MFFTVFIVLFQNFKISLKEVFYMNDVILYLQNIQNNLVGIVIPVVVSAIVSIITLIANFLLQIILTYKKYNSRQYNIMRKYYPELKVKLINLMIIYKELEDNPLHKKDFNILKYIDFDWVAHRRNLDKNEILCIDSFESNIKDIINQLNDLNDFFRINNIPTSNRKVKKALNIIQFNCALIKYFERKQIDVNLHKTIKRKTQLNYAEIVKLIKILDKQFNRF